MERFLYVKEHILGMVFIQQATKRIIPHSCTGVWGLCLHAAWQTKYKKIAAPQELRLFVQQRPWGCRVRITWSSGEAACCVCDALIEKHKRLRRVIR